MRRLLLALSAVLTACADDSPEKPLAPTDPTVAACATMQGNIEKLLGGKFPARVPVDIVDVEFIARFAAALEEQLIPPGLADTSRRLAERMKLVPKGFDVTAAQIELVKLIVVGLYDPQKDRFYLVDGRASPGRPGFADTVAHELIHAYRDIDKRYFEKTLAAVMVDADRAVAISCLTEGDASILGEALGATLEAAADPVVNLRRIAAGADAEADNLGKRFVPPLLRKIPYGIREMALGRYGAGRVFAAKLYASGGLDALAAAYDAPPRSTEQVLHPEKYIGPDVDEPTLFSGGSPVAALGAGWKAAMSNTFGEFEMRVHFAELLGRDAAWRAADGWDGARYHFCEKDGAPGFFGMITTWDTENDAQEFARAWADWAGKRDGKDPRQQMAGKRAALKTDDGLVVTETVGRDVLVADGVPPDRIEAVLEALASATRK